MSLTSRHPTHYGCADWWRAGWPAAPDDLHSRQHVGFGMSPPRDGRCDIGSGSRCKIDCEFGTFPEQARRDSRFKASRLLENHGSTGL
jgi:hypothetical protein